MIENVSTQLTVFHCFAHCLLPGRAFASLYVLLFLEKEAEIGGRDIGRSTFNILKVLMKIKVKRNHHYGLSISVRYMSPTHSKNERNKIV